MAASCMLVYKRASASSRSVECPKLVIPLDQFGGRALALQPDPVNGGARPRGRARRPMPFQSIEPRRLYRQIADQIRDADQERRVPGRRAAAARARSREAARRVAAVGARSADRAGGRGTGRGADRLGHLRAGPASEATVAGAAARTRHARRARSSCCARATSIESECAALAAKSAKKAQVAGHRGGAGRRCSARSTARESAAGRRPPLPHADRRGHRQRRAGGGGEDAVGGAHGPALQAARAPLRYARRCGTAAMAEHRAVLKAIAGHDAPGARAAMQRHLNQAYKRFNKGWRHCTERPRRRTRPAVTARAAAGDRCNQEDHHACLPHSRQGRPAHRAGRHAGGRARARCCCAWAPPASAAPTSTITSRAATAASSCASR